MNVERANPRRVVSGSATHLSIVFELIAAEKRFSFTPASAAYNFILNFGDKVSAVT